MEETGDRQEGVSAGGGGAMKETNESMDSWMLFAMCDSQSCSRWPPWAGTGNPHGRGPRLELTALTSAAAGTYEGVFSEDFTF